MNTTTIKPGNTTYNTGFPPVPVETHLKAKMDGQTKTVVLNGSKILMKVINGRWVNFVVAAAY